MAGTGARNYRWPSLRVVAVYFTVASAWIFLSDRLLATFVDSPHVNTFQTAKGWLFVALTSWLLYVLIARVLATSRAAEADTTARHNLLDLILTQLPGTVWTVDRDLTIVSVEGTGPAGLVRDPDRDLVGTTLYERLGTRDEDIAPLRAHLDALAGKRSGYTIDWDEGTVEAAVAPLRMGSDIVGAVGFSLDVTERVRLERERLANFARLQRTDEERARLLRHLVRAQEAERDRIAAGLHDDSVQLMTSVGMAIDLLMESITGGPHADLLARSRSNVTRAIKSLRSLVFDLKPLALDKEGLGAAVTSLLEEKKAEAGFEYSFTNELGSSIPHGTRHIVYRVVQEAMANIVKHARASYVSVILGEHRGGVELKVVDDGEGFDPIGPRKPKHFGLSDMEQRADIAGGWCNIDSTPGRGTVVHAWIPIDPAQDGVIDEISA